MRRRSNLVPSLLAMVAVALLASGCDSKGASSGDPGDVADAADERLDIFRFGDRVSLMGNALAERMQHHGWLEARLQTKLADQEMRFRNLGFSADELTVQQRTSGFGSWDDYLERCKTSLIFAFFGFNESFAGVGEAPRFRADLDTFLAQRADRQYDGRAAPRIVLFSSIPFENTGDPNLPDGVAHNERIEAYNAQLEAAAAAHEGVTYLDVYTPMTRRYASAARPLTINGIHLTEAGNAVLAEEIERAVFGDVREVDAAMERTRQAILEKNLLWFNRYRATDGFNVYGGRSSLSYKPDDTSNYTVLQREMHHLDALCEKHDEKIWAMSRGKTSFEIDMTGVPELLTVETNKPGKGEGGKHIYISGEDAIAKMDVAPGMKVELFADESMFPELVNPVQMAWDTKGRLWVAAWPTYPHWTPGQPMNDKLLVLEDTDGDGRADECTHFADDLHNPTGFEFWNGGVVVAQCPDLLFLEDTDGDGKADRRERLLHGLSSADTHHAANSFVIGPDGALYFQEGTFHMSQVESIYGPIRNHNGCVWRFEPRTFRVERYIPYNFANPHGHVFDRWGQDFMTDGTGNVNYYSLAFSGHITHPDKHRGYFPFFKQASRPCAGTEILSSSHFPEKNQGNYLVANVITFLGIYQYEMHDDGSGFKATMTDHIVRSSDPNFRPSDIEVGPDGAIYFLDWHNAIIGHMQHHLRDPSRDVAHGRVYRVRCEGRDLLKPVPVAGQSIEALVANLASPDDRVRYRSRLELSARPAKDVLAAAKAWQAGLDPAGADHEHHLMEVLWLHQQFNQVDMPLLEKMLKASDGRARAAATRVLRQMRHRIADAGRRLRPMANDPHPRVRLEAVVGASFVGGDDGVAAALDVLKHPMDRFLTYALGETMRELDATWKSAIRAGSIDFTDNPKGIAYLIDRVGPDELVKLPRTPGVLRAIVNRNGIPAAQRRGAIEELAKSTGKTASDVALEAIRSLDRGNSRGAGHVIRELGLLLQDFMATAKPDRAVLTQLAGGGRRDETRACAYGALVRLDGNADAAFAEARGSRKGLKAFLGSVSGIGDENVRAALYDDIRELMFELPEKLQLPRKAGGARGIRVAVYESNRFPNCELARMREMDPVATGEVPNITFDVPQLTRRDRVGLVFDGTIVIPRTGDWVFFTNSDDGSRLYIDGKLVVNNDGDHAMRERRGRVRLGAGPHEIQVTYYDQGGGDGLRVSWRGPGVKKQRIPDEAFALGGVDVVRAAAVRAMAHLPGRESDKLGDAARLFEEGDLVEPAVYLVENTPREKWSPAAVGRLITSVSGWVEAIPPEERTAPRVVAALQMGRTLASSLPDAQGDAAKKRLRGLGGSVILVRTLPHQMRFDRTEFVVAAGRPVGILFQNNDVMPHNLVVTKPGALEAVGEAAEAMGPTPGAQAKGYVPERDDVLWHTGLLLPGQSDRVSFVAPSEPGEYPYVCTFPGHWRVMNGVMRVVDELGEADVAANEAAPAEAAPTREFVKMWKVSDFAKPLSNENWARGRNLKRGSEMFDVAGCAKCHKFQGRGLVGGPDLTEIATKFRGRELLRQIIDPSTQVLEGYSNFAIKTKKGRQVVGRITEEKGDSICVVPNLMEPDVFRLVKKSDIAARKALKLSPMPTGLLVTLKRNEILDLLAFLESGVKK